MGGFVCWSLELLSFSRFLFSWHWVPHLNDLVKKKKRMEINNNTVADGAIWMFKQFYACDKILWWWKVSRGQLRSAEILIKKSQIYKLPYLIMLFILYIIWLRALIKESYFLQQQLWLWQCKLAPRKIWINLNQPPFLI